MLRLIKTSTHLGQRLPFTLVMLAGIIIVGIATGTPTQPIAVAPQQRWGFAFADFSHGAWYSLFTSVLLVNRPLMFWGILLFVGGSVGIYEWLVGWRRALCLFWLTDLGGHLAVALLVVLPLYSLGTATGYELAHSHDVGMSGGGFGCLGGWMSHLPRHWRTASLTLAAMYLLLRLLVFTELFPDLLHLLTFFGGYGYATWQGRAGHRRRGPHGQGER
jgi:hypothetical protein